MKLWTVLLVMKMETAIFCEPSNEHLSFIDVVEFLLLVERRRLSEKTMRWSQSINEY